MARFFLLILLLFFITAINALNIIPQDKIDNFSVIPNPHEANIVNGNISNGLSHDLQIKFSTRLRIALPVRITDSKTSFESDSLSAVNTKKLEMEDKLSNIIMQKWIYLGCSLISFGTATFFYIESNRNYINYKNASTDATDLHKKINTQDIIWPVSYGLSAACFGMFIFKSIQQGKVKSRYSLGMVPAGNGAVVTICYTF